MLKTVSNVLAVLLVLAGGVFALQGLSLLPGTYMRGSSQWVVIGALMVLAGAGLLAAANWPRRP